MPIPNTKFLEEYLTRSTEEPTYALLPHERGIIDDEIARQRQVYEHLIEEKLAVTGGDDWHDGAFRATDNEARLIGHVLSSMAPFLEAEIVEYPDYDISVATLGSRVSVEQRNSDRTNDRGFTFPIDIVGYRQGYPDNIIDETTGEEVIGVSPDAPLGRAIIGHEIGYQAEYQAGSGLSVVTIVGIDQLAIRALFEQQADSLSSPTD